MAERRTESDREPDIKEKETYVVKDDNSSNTGTIIAIVLIILIIALFFIFGGFGGGDSGGGTEDGTDINVEAPSDSTTN